MRWRVMTTRTVARTLKPILGNILTYRPPDMKRGTAAPKRSETGVNVAAFRRAAKEITRGVAAGVIPGRDAAEWLAGHPNGGVRQVGAMVLAALPVEDWKWHAGWAARLADDENWEVREGAVAVAASLVMSDYKRGLKLIRSWATGDNVNRRRAAALTVMVKKRRGWPGPVEDIFAVLEPLMSDRAEYVRKNLGPFAIGSSIGIHHPAETVAFLRRVMATGDEQARWNCAMAFSQSWGAQRPDLAIPILTELAGDGSKYVRTAAAAALRNVGRRHPRMAEVILKQWRDDPRRQEVASRVLNFLNKK